MLPQLANHGRVSVLQAVGQFEQPATSQDDDFFGRGRSITSGLFVVRRGFIKRNRRRMPSVNTAAFCGIYVGRRPFSGKPTIQPGGRCDSFRVRDHPGIDRFGQYYRVAPGLLLGHYTKITKMESWSLAETRWQRGSAGDGMSKLFLPFLATGYLSRQILRRSPSLLGGTETLLT